MTRFPVLDGLRATSILMVLSAHMLPLGPRILQLNHSAGAMGMALFFALSGFLITSNLLKNQNIAGFFVRRIMRIVPLAYLYLFTVYVAIQYKPAMFVGNLWFIENYSHHLLDEWNAHFWSLCVEIHFYVAIGCFVLLLGSRGIWIVVPACLAITLLRAHNGAYIDIRTHLRVDEILVGACVALFFHRGWLNFKAPSPWFGAAIGLWFVTSSEFSGSMQYFRPYATAAVLSFALCMKPSRVKSILESEVARYIAGISYALYVIHPATVHGWMNEGSTAVRYLLKRPISLIMTFFLAHLSTYYWESRWIQLAKRVTRK